MKLTDYHLYTTSFEYDNGNGPHVITFDYTKNTFHFKSIQRNPYLDIMNFFGSFTYNEEQFLLHLFLNSDYSIQLQYTFLENKVKFDYDLLDFFISKEKRKKDFWMYYDVSMAIN